MATKKELLIPWRVLQLEALLARLSKEHPKYVEIQEEYGRRKAGYKGEQSLPYYLSMLDQKEYHIFHNLRLQDPANHTYFEMDILLLTKNFITIIDSKHYSGIVEFDPVIDQIIQTVNNEEKAYPCPISQVNRHQVQLRRLLNAQGFTHIPIEPLVCLTHPSTIVKISPKHPQVHKVIKSQGLLTKLENFERRYQTQALSHKEIQKLTRQLIKLHTEKEDDILGQFGISKR